MAVDDETRTQCKLACRNMAIRAILQLHDHLRNHPISVFEGVDKRVTGLYFRGIVKRELIDSCEIDHNNNKSKISGTVATVACSRIQYVSVDISLQYTNTHTHTHTHTHIFVPASCAQLLPMKISPSKILPTGFFFKKPTK
jgi:hypothetical protein